MVIYNSRQLAEIFNLPERTIRAQLQRGALPGKKISGHWYTRKEDLDVYLMPDNKPTAICQNGDNDDHRGHE